MKYTFEEMLELMSIGRTITFLLNDTPVVLSACDQKLGFLILNNTIISNQAELDCFEDSILSQT